MNVLILGGTGAIGKHLVSELCMNIDYDIYVTSRSNRESKKNNVHYIKGDAHDYDFLTKLLKQNNWDVIVDFMVYNSVEFQRRIDTILESVGQYIFLSTCRVFADSEYPITETSPRLLDTSNDYGLLKSDDYPITKAKQENILFNHNMQNWTIVRPYITFSSQRLQLGVLEKEYWLYRAVNKNSVVFSKDISNSITTLTFGKDVSIGISKLIWNKKAIGETVNITTKENMYWSEVLDVYKKTYYEITGDIMNVNLVSDPNINAFAVASVWPLKYDRLYNRIFDNSKFMHMVGSDFTFSDSRQMLAKCLKEFYENGCEFKPIPYSTMAYYDRICGEKTIFSDHSLKRKIEYFLIKYTELYKKSKMKVIKQKHQELL